jgi:hypothetical protein
VNPKLLEGLGRKIETVALLQIECVMKLLPDYHHKIWAYEIEDG